MSYLKWRKVGVDIPKSNKQLLIHSTRSGKFYLGHYNSVLKGPWVYHGLKGNVAPPETHNAPSHWVYLTEPTAEMIQTTAGTQQHACSTCGAALMPPSYAMCNKCYAGHSWRD